MTGAVIWSLRMLNSVVFSLSVYHLPLRLMQSDTVVALDGCALYAVCPWSTHSPFLFKSYPLPSKVTLYCHLPVRVRSDVTVPVAKSQGVAAAVSYQPKKLYFSVS